LKSFWERQFSDSEINEEVLIRVYKDPIFWKKYPHRFKSGYLGALARMFGTTDMAVNKKLGELRQKGIVDDVSESTVTEQAKKGLGNEWIENKESGTASLDVVSKDFLKTEEALKTHNIDMDYWEITHLKRGMWTTPLAARVYKGTIVRDENLVKNYYIRFTFKRKKVKHFELAAQGLIDKIPLFKFKEQVPAFVAPSGVALEIAPIDAHFAKLAWGVETLRVDYDLDIAVKNYMHVIEQNLAWGSVFRPEKIFFIVGNDLMHSENYSGTTPSGHNILDVDTRLPKLIEAALEINVKAIYKCRELAAVEVLWIPGNPDPTASLWLCMALKHHFKEDEFVKVDVSPAVRKARLWGNLLVGWTHMITGKHAAWANELAQAFPELWGKSKFREWHHGHLHKKSEVKTTPVMTQGGVLMRQLTALSPIDAWHFENLFTDAVPGGEAFLWSKDKGVFSNFVAWL